MAQKLAYIGKLLYFCEQNRKTQTTMVATQPTFNQVYDLAAMLTWQDQRRLVQEVQNNIRQYEKISPMTKDELLARVEHADALIDEGHYTEHDAAKRHFQSRIAQKTQRL